MKLNFISLAKVYTVFFGLIYFSHILSLLGINETIAGAPPHFSIWWWHLILFLIYGVFPIITVLIDNEKSYLMVAGFSLVGIFVEAFKVFTRITDFYFIFALVDIFAFVLSLYLAVENVASKVSAEILSLGWSQF